MPTKAIPPDTATKSLKANNFSMLSLYFIGWYNAFAQGVSIILEAD